MATICDRCEKLSYVTYVKSNGFKLCDLCEDEERVKNGRLNECMIIKSNKRK